MQKVRKRRESIIGDDYWMGLAFMVAAGSTSMRQQGCVLVGTNNNLITVACDGSPSNMQDSDHIVHAETNALLKISPQLGGTAYLTHTPCYNCCLNLLTANFKRIIYNSTKTIDPNTLNAAQTAYGRLEEYKGNLNWMRDYLASLDIF